MLDAKYQSLVLTDPIRRLMSILQEDGGEARVVGGAVRDALLNRPIGDFDLATDLRPERVIEILDRHSVRTVPTGISHGTVTAVVDRVGYEITTLRHDIATDGRHAEVSYTDDWRADADRRDFTFNALYVDANGELYDYFKGHADLKAGHVRFIGDAHARIREDVLRILRFFRFHAWFGKGSPDGLGLAACRELAGLLPKLSVERVSRELLKLLAAPDPLPSWRLMLENSILKSMLPEASHLEGLKILLANEKKYGEISSALVRLVALFAGNPEGVRSVATRLKFATRDADFLFHVVSLPPLTEALKSSHALRKLVYKFGPECVRAGLLLQSIDVKDGLAVLHAWEGPVFPLKGEDIVSLGVPAGPQVGGILRQVEAWWIAGDFRAEKNMCLVQANKSAREL